MSFFVDNLAGSSVVKSVNLPHSAGKATVSKFFCAIALSLLATMVASASSADAPVPIPTGNGAAGATDLSSYHYPYANGLYATLAGYLSLKDVDLNQQQVLKLKVDKFQGRMPVRAIIQPHVAPLVVVLLGLDGEAKGKLGKLWASWYASAGYHVLTFDSTFRASFIEISGHGVTGNLGAESECVRDIISAFLVENEIKGKVSKIGVVGMSYGGLQALMLGQMAAENKLPFKLDAVQSYSPPINLQKTGERIDRWYAEDRWNYTLIELADKIAGHKPVSANEPVPFDDSLMRAGIAAIFRLGLVDVITRNDRVYKMKLLPSGNEFDDQYVKQDYAATWGYSKFMTDMSYAYWKDRKHFNVVSDLVRPTQLDTLLPAQPAFSETIIAVDDPFNESEDMAAIMANFHAPTLTILPRGGHLGYVNEAWTKAKLLSLFKTNGTEGSR